MEDYLLQHVLIKGQIYLVVSLIKLGMIPLMKYFSMYI
jgi:hypothetical protein